MPIPNGGSARIFPVRTKDTGVQLSLLNFHLVLLPQTLTFLPFLLLSVPVSPELTANLAPLTCNTTILRGSVIQSKSSKIVRGIKNAPATHHYGQTSSMTTFGYFDLEQTVRGGMVDLPTFDTYSVQYQPPTSMLHCDSTNHQDAVYNATSLQQFGALTPGGDGGSSFGSDHDQVSFLYGLTYLEPEFNIATTGLRGYEFCDCCTEPSLLGARRRAWRQS